jgi:hypothetical protein
MEETPPDPVGDVEVEEELRPGGASMTLVVYDGPRRSAMHPAGWRERER